MPRTEASLTNAEHSLVTICGFEWSDTFGCWLSEDDESRTTRWESTDDVLQECHANAAIGYRAVPPSAR